MGLETATYINELNASWPLGDDPIREADDHMRLIKSTLQNTFPNITGMVNANEGELNLLVGQTSFPTVAGVDEQVQFNSGGNFAGSSNLTFDGTQLTAGALLVLGLTTLGLNDLSAEGIGRASSTGSIFVSGGPSQSSGAHLTMYGSSNATVPGNVAFTVDSDDDFMLWDNSAGAFRINVGTGAVKNLGMILSDNLTVIDTDDLLLRSSESGDPTAGGSITQVIGFESSDPNRFGEIGYLASADSLDIRNYAYDADVNIFATDGVSLTTEYGITFNSQAFEIKLDVATFPETIIDFDSSGAAVVTDASIQMYTYIKDYPGVGIGTDGYALAWNNAAGRIELTNVGGGGGATPGGADTNVQFNNAGTFGGEVEFTYDGTKLFLDTTRRLNINSQAADEISLAGVSGSIIVGNELGLTVSIDRNTIQAKSNSTTAGSLYINDLGGDVNFGNGIALTSMYVNAPLVTLGSWNLLTSQNPGAPEDNYVLTYDFGTDRIQLEPSAGGGGGIGGSIATDQIAVGSATADEIEGSADFTWDSASDLLTIGDATWPAPQIFMNAATGGNIEIEFQEAGTAKGRVGWYSSIAGGQDVMRIGSYDPFGSEVNSVTQILADNTVIGTYSQSGLAITRGIQLTERSSKAYADNALKGQLYIKDTDNLLYYVDGVGTEYDLTGGGGGGGIGGSIADNQIAVGAAVANDIEGSSSFTWDGNDVTISAGGGDNLRMIGDFASILIESSGNINNARIEGDYDDTTTVDNRFLRFSINGGTKLSIGQNDILFDRPLFIEQRAAQRANRTGYGQLWVDQSDDSLHYVTEAGVDTDLTAGGGGGDVFKVGTPVDNQVGVWTGDGTIEGDANFTWSGTTLALAVNAANVFNVSSSTVGSNTVASFAGNGVGLGTVVGISGDPTTGQVVDINSTGVGAGMRIQGGTDAIEVFTGHVSFRELNSGLRFEDATGVYSRIYHAGATGWFFDNPLDNGDITFRQFDDGQGIVFLVDDSGGTQAELLRLENDQIIVTGGELQIGEFNETENTFTGAAGTKNLDISAATVFSASSSMAGNAITFTFDNPPASGRAATITLILNAASTATLTWPASVDWPGGTEPSWSTGIDVVSFVSVDGGSTWLGFLGGLDFS